MSGRLKLNKNDDVVAYSETAIRNNASVVEYCRTSMAALSGCTAGLLGLTGLCGAGFYIFAVIGLWVLLLSKAGPNWQQYFISRKTLLTNGFFGQLFTYVLCWTFIYGMVSSFIASILEALREQELRLNHASEYVKNHTESALTQINVGCSKCKNRKRH